MLKLLTIFKKLTDKTHFVKYSAKKKQILVKASVSVCCI